MNATSQNPSEPRAGTTKRRMLAGLWKNLPSENAAVLFSDATANRDDLEALLGRPVTDVTPSGHLARVKRVVQYPLDIVRATSHSRFASIIRGVLTEFRSARYVGIITHRPLVGAIKKLGEPFAGRLVKAAYFGSGSDRASNDWHERCDLVIVAGTPRVPGEAVQRRLIQFGDFTSAGEDGRWGPCRWKGTTETGEKLIVEGRGYDQRAWERAHRSLVRAAIVQAAGRGRTLLDTGCDVAVISTEECGFPVVSNPDIELSETEVKALVVITDLSEPESYRSSKSMYHRSRSRRSCESDVVRGEQIMGKTVVAYLRVSTKGQGESGLGLEAQQAAIESFAQQNRGTVARSYLEVESGRKSDRPQLAAAIAHAKRSRATLVVAKLDRLGRNVAFLSALMEAKVDFVACDNPAANKLTLHILAAVAEAEAEAISARTKAALAAYKARGGKLGAARPECRNNLPQEARKRGAKAAGEAVTANANAAYVDLAPLFQDFQSRGLSQHAIAAELNQQGHTTRRGKPWSQVQVGRVLQRLAIL